MNLRLRFGLFLLLGGTAFCRLSERNISHHSQELEAVISRMMECNHLPGLAVSVVQRGHVWAKGFGDAVIGNVPFSPDTKVPIGTLANIFTTILLDNILVRQGNSRFYPYRKIRWRTPVRHILTNVTFSDPFLNEKLTAEDLATDRTGLSSLPILWKAGALPDTLNRSVLASNFHKIPKFPQYYPFRVFFDPNPLAHGLMGRFTEVLGNGTWKQLMQDRILNALQLNDTGFLGDPLTTIRADRRFAMPYAYCPDCPSYFRTRFTIDTPLNKYRLPVVYPDNGMVTTVKDMAKFLAIFLNTSRSPKRGLFRSYQFIHPSTNVFRDYPGAYNFRKPWCPVSYRTFSRGRGWFIAKYHGYELVWSVGKLHNYMTYTAALRDLDLGMTFFANSAGSRSFNTMLMSYIIDMAAGEGRWLNNSTVCPLPRGHRKRRPNLVLLYLTLRLTNTTAIENATEVVGTYRDPVFGEVTVTQKGQTLHATYGRFSGDLSKTTEFKEPDFKFNPAGMGSELLIRFREKSDGQKMLYLCDPLGYEGYLIFSKTTNESNKK